jgi:hypothetical protein
VADSVFEVPYAESVRMLTQQASALDNLRSRASTILAAAALVTTFLGGQALAKASAPLSPWGWAAIAALFGVLGCTLWVLYPWNGWIYGQSATQMIRRFDSTEPPPDLERLHRATAMSLEQNFRDNEIKLERLSWAFRLACILTVAETALWIVNLGSLP